jgi:ribosome-binding factor A
MSKRRYARTDRVNELLREILAERLGRFDDERLDLVTITGVEVDAGLEHAVVYYSSLADEEADESILEAFEEARIRNTPRLAFRADHGIRQGQRVEAILRDLATSGGLSDDDVEGTVATPDGGSGDDAGQGGDIIGGGEKGATEGGPETR